MRVIGGKFRGRKIKFPLSLGTRPTKDRIRESVFNVLSYLIVDSSILDLFAGSGAYGIESISRGARGAVFVEKNYRTCDAIKSSLETLKIKEQCEIVKSDVFKAIKSLNKNNKSFDIIFCDPPYSKYMSKNVLRAITQYDILSPSGLFVLEHHTSESVPAECDRLKLFKEKKYKDIVISIYTSK